MITALNTGDLPECCDLAESRGWWREERKWRLLFDVGTVYGVREQGRLIGTTGDRDRWFLPVMQALG